MRVRGTWGPRRVAVATLVVAAVGILPTVAVAAPGNEAPLADAGLDRKVTANATVYLDATGSRDPDGEIAAYEWRIERPNGSYTNPDCRSCGRTSFVPREPGTYNATVTVTDDDGATSIDTLRVHVDPSNGPSVTINGPSTVDAGDLAGYSASVSAGNEDLIAVVWRLDGRRLNRTSVSGGGAVVDHGYAFVDTGNATVSATVVDRLGRERTQQKEVTVVEPSSVSSGTDSASADASGTGSDDDCYYPDDSVFSCEADSVSSNNGTAVTIADTDRDGNVTVNGQNFSVMEGDTVTINQSTWEAHYQVSRDEDALFEGRGEPVYYQPGIRQGPEDTNIQMVGQWNIPPASDSATSTETDSDDNTTGPWRGNSDQNSGSNSGSSRVSDDVPERVQEQIDRRRDDGN